MCSRVRGAERALPASPPSVAREPTRKDFPSFRDSEVKVSLSLRAIRQCQVKAAVVGTQTTWVILVVEREKAFAHLGIRISLQRPPAMLESTLARDRIPDW